MGKKERVNLIDSCQSVRTARIDGKGAIIGKQERNYLDVKGLEKICLACNEYTTCVKKDLFKNLIDE